MASNENSRAPRGRFASESPSASLASRFALTAVTGWTGSSPKRSDIISSGSLSALKILATRGRNAKVLQHTPGYLEKQLDDESRQELQDLTSLTIEEAICR